MENFRNLQSNTNDAQQAQQQAHAPANPNEHSLSENEQQQAHAPANPDEHSLSENAQPESTQEVCSTNPPTHPVESDSGEQHADSNSLSHTQTQAIASTADNTSYGNSSGQPPEINTDEDSASTGTASSNLSQLVADNFPSPRREAFRTDPERSSRFAKRAARYVSGNVSNDIEPDEYTEPTSYLSRLLPRGLFGRSLLILIAPLMLAQFFVGAVFIDRHVDIVTLERSSTYAAEVSILLDKWLDDNNFSKSGDRLNLPANSKDGAPEQTPGFVISEELKQWGERLGLTIAVLPSNVPLSIESGSVRYGVLREAAPLALQKVIDFPSGFTIYPEALRIETRVKVAGVVVAFSAHRNNAFPGNYHIFLNWMMFATLLVQLLTAYFLRYQIDPIRRLARAAEAWGRGEESVQLRDEGAREVKQAARAFRTMRARLDRYVFQRTSMLAGVSHDLRTMLTRIKLGLGELTPTTEIVEIKSDVEQMRIVVQDYLDFARGIADEGRVRINVEDFTRNLVNRIPAGNVVISVSCSGPRHIRSREITLERCLLNLVTNAVTHAERRVRVVVSAEQTADDSKSQLLQGILLFSVEDDGPGIPPNDRERVFEPFVRLDNGRSLDRPGSGLGMAIARDCARVLGGDVELATSPLGGLAARVYLPL